MKMGLTNLNANINIFLNVKMGITGANRCYFVVWTPHGTHIELIEFDSVFFRNMKNDFNFYYKNFYLKSIFTVNCITSFTR